MVRGKDSGGLSGADTARPLAASILKEEIEKLTVKAVREHREAVAKAEDAFHAWQGADSASDDATALHNEYTKLLLTSRAQHMVVATLIERLGYIPNVPES